MSLRAAFEYEGTTDAWAIDAVCADMDVSDFFLGRGQSRKASAIIAICNGGCPVKAECLNAARIFESGEDRNNRFGVWGGTLPYERWLMDRNAGLLPHRKGMTYETHNPYTSTEDPSGVACDHRPHIQEVETYEETWDYLSELQH